ncbi:hypothetical protein [Streptomonospora wellingtoniae]|uniref:Uncharacterized protein n=1 Tax=Streptomonospora wellingtoniae TaxID=3075544 RepID=A0ABU2KNX3_9ACTN|nr:hypothetical protein [Streptomonospora sp. DSM 45055]MDT0300959.1 hypothetical protein [Streptomonospora sp. DSM 45055]
MPGRNDENGRHRSKKTWRAKLVDRLVGLTEIEFAAVAIAAYAYRPSLLDVVLICAVARRG